MQRPSGNTVGLRSLNVEVHRPENRGFIRVEVAPSMRITPHGIYIGINSHFQLSHHERRGNGYEVTAVLDESWEDTRQLEHQIIKRLLEVI